MNTKQNNNTEQSGTDFSQNDEIANRTLIQTIYQRRWVVMLIATICLVAGIAYARFAPRQYTSTSTLYVESNEPKIIEDNDRVISQPKNYLQTQCRLLKSTPIITAALEKTGMADLEVFDGVDNVIAYLKENLDVEVGKDDDIIRVSFESQYPQESAMIVNNIVDAYVTYNSSQKKTTTGEVLKILIREKGKFENEFNEKLTKTLQFKKDNDTLSFQDNKGNIIIQRLARLSEAFTEAQLQSIDAKSANVVSRLMMKNNQKVCQVIDLDKSDAAFTAFAREESRISCELNKLRVDLAALKQELTDEHPAVQALKVRIKELNSQLQEKANDFAQNYSAYTNQKFAVAEEKKQAIQEIFNQQREVAEILNNKAAQYAILQSDLVRTEKLCDTIDSRIKELNVTENAGALNINIVEVAKAETEPTSPNVARVIIIAVAFGLIFGIGWAVVAQWLDGRFNSADEIASVSGIPVLAAVPFMAGKESPSEIGQTVILEPVSHAAEEYRSIRTKLYFSSPQHKEKTILVTSPLQGDGKTTLVSNLAIAIAQTHRKTLVLDADFRKPMQHKVFMVDNNHGLASVLAGIDEIEQAIQKTAIEFLDVVPCGPIPPNPSEMLQSKDFAEILEKLSDKYDQIVIDSPPVIPVTDSCILGAICDVTVLALRTDNANREACKKACDGLVNVGANLMGVVVNAARHDTGGYGYYNTYKYQSYGKEPEVQTEETVIQNVA